MLKDGTGLYGLPLTQVVLLRISHSGEERMVLQPRSARLLASLIEEGLATAANPRSPDDTVAARAELQFLADSLTGRR